MVERFERFSLAISEISRYWHRIAGEEMERYGLRGAHSVYLLALNRCPEGVTAAQLSEICGKDKADVSRMLAMMERQGLVLREGAGKNRYRGLVRLTEAGREAAAHVSARAGVAVSVAGQGLSEAQRAILYESLEHIAINLKKICREGLPEGTDAGEAQA